jgi:hypothetical protein
MQHYPGDYRYHNQHINRRRDAEGPGDEEIEAGIGAAEGKAGGSVGCVTARDAAIDEQAAQGDHEGLHAQLGNQQAVNQAEPDAEHNDDTGCDRPGNAHAADHVDEQHTEQRDH